VIPVAPDYDAAARALVDRLAAEGIRVTLDSRNETLNRRIREGELAKVPYMAVIGRREAEEGTVALRTRGAGAKQEILAVDAFTARLLGEVRGRTLAPEGPRPGAPPAEGAEAP
jgi:threonyl-tRNA synthetase